MPFARIEIEQFSHERWHAEVEAGVGLESKRRHLTGSSMEEIFDAVYAQYRELVPADPPAPPPAPENAIDLDVLPPKPKPPIGRRQAQRQREQADAQAFGSEAAAQAAIKAAQRDKR